MNKHEHGFTLIELMVAIAMSSIVVGVIYSAYTVQTRIYTEQDKVAEMQQNLRSGFAFMQREARMAGYNPNDAKDVSCDAPGAGAKAVAPGIHTATATTFGFSMDLNEDGDCADAAENVTYSLSVAIPRNLERAAPVGKQPIAENISGIDFIYLAEPPLVGTTATKTPTSDPFSAANKWKSKDIVAVQVSLLVQAKQQSTKIIDKPTFTVAFPDVYGNYDHDGTTWGPFAADNYNRRMLTAMVNCRNMGL